MASHTPNGSYSEVDVGNTYQPCPTSPTPPPVPTKSRPPIVRQTSPPLGRKRLYYYDATPGVTASLPRNIARNKVPPQPTPRSPQHHRPSREPIGYMRPISNSHSMTHEAPMVPERPRPRSASAVPSRKVQKRNKEVFLSEGMLLPDFVKRYSKSFPVHIKVLKGYCGPSSRLTISTSDTYNIHFLKHTKVVAIKDAHDTPYSIPLNSAIEFGLVYDPNDNRGEAIHGRTFEKISEIISTHTPPKVFCALKAFRGEDEKSSVYDNEVLIVKQVLKPRFKGKRALKVHSLLTQSEKLLHEDCIGRFTTQPYMVRMHLLELIEHVVHPFPHQAIVFFSPDIYQNPETAAQVQELPDTILSKVITMCHCITETSLIASSLLERGRRYSDSDSDSDIDNLFDIPVDENLAEIEIAIMETNSAEVTEKLYDDTRSIVERFNPSKVRSCKDTGSEHTFTAQSLFYSAVRPGCENVGIEIDTPSTIYDNIKPRPLPSKRSPPSKQRQLQPQDEIQHDKGSVQQHMPQQHAQQQHAQQQRPPQQHLPQQHAQQQHAQQQRLPQQHLPQQHAQQQHAQQQRLPQQHLPQQHAQQQHAQQQRLPQQHAQQQHAQQQRLPQQHLPQQYVPGEPVPQQHVPQQQVPRQHAQKQVPQQHIQQQVPQQQVPRQHAQQQVPLQQVQQQVPQQQVPQQHVQQQVPQQQVPQQQVPQEQVPQQHVQQQVTQLTYQPQATTTTEDENYDTIDRNDDVFDGDYDEVEAAINKHKQSLAAEETTMAAKVSTLQLCTKGLKTRITSLESASQKQTQDLQAVKSSVDQLLKQFKTLEAKCEQLAASQLISQSQPLPCPDRMNGEGSEGGSSSKEANRQTLRSVNSVQVQNLLDAMDLTQYKEKFTQEHITGEIFAELDDDILQHELGVSSKIHRIRLMKVVSGHHSVQQILSRVDPYVSFGSQ